MYGRTYIQHEASPLLHMKVLEAKPIIELMNDALACSSRFSFFGHFLHVASTNEYWFTIFIPNIYYVWHNKWVLLFWFVNLVGHRLSPRTCCKLFTKFGSNIWHFFWFWWGSNHLSIHKWLEDFFYFMLWDLGLLPYSCISLFLGFPIFVANNPHRMTKSLFDKSLRRLVK